MTFKKIQESKDTNPVSKTKARYDKMVEKLNA